METIYLKLPSVVNSFKNDKNYLYHTVASFNLQGFEVEDCVDYLKLVQVDLEVIVVDPEVEISLKGFTYILEVSDIKKRNEELIELVEKGVWIEHPRINKEMGTHKNSSDIVGSWKNNFFNKKGLRNPQLGALSSALAHWTISNDTATIVMPTGTGKTETMLSVMIAAKLEKVLVIVPSNALRKQISDKFISLGILAELGLIEDILYPVVGVMSSKLKKNEDLEAFLSNCNVIVTTMQLISGYNNHMKERIAEEFDCLIIDEAHHVPALTWNNFKNFFGNKKILQFTATPFRNDGKHIEGQIIYNYPLHKAQAEGYFHPINFIPLEEYDDIKSDEIIAKNAVEQLEEDLRQNYDHVLMARVKSSARADEVYELYKSFSQHKPVKIYSTMKKKDQETILQQINSRDTRIIVCVDMLGEGFDLPNLKIAALHDKHQSLAITLQFIGRFTRTSKKLGNATLVANIANEKISEQIEELYQLDSDWNQLINQKSKETIDKRINLDQIAEGFEGQIKELSIQEIRPKTSTVLYKTYFPKWTPEELEKSIKDVENTIIMRNVTLNILIVVQKKKVSVPWSKSKDFHDISWEASIFYWNPEKQLLFVNNSNNQWLDQWIKK
ncbi:DEAD/DEAH box helicase [Sporosarcina limicola]|uniref:Superfamily II DNA or RNA helicase n=1 Tax=Sporosarcina limicola TaxID=34101 RepID=A0A927R3V5_9BACL|nr:DEAD/DEAH box helicase family protein [Sporosarcina limicola]MBE1555496.1 superfamily II DNA or RNA helicase [Sporosarcina limicola]